MTTAARFLTSPYANKPHYVYRFYAEDGSLLYCGCTSNLGQRLVNHASTKDWWLEVRGVEVEWYPTQREGLDAERAVIEATQPKYNSMFTDRHDSNGWTRRRARMALVHDAGLPCRDTTCKQGCGEKWHALGIPCGSWSNCEKCRDATDYQLSHPAIDAWDEAHYKRDLAPLDAWVVSQAQERAS